MNLAIILAALTALATTAGGLLALRARDRLHLVLGLSAGLLLGLVAFDLLPEVFHATEKELLHVPAVSVAIIAGFLALHILEQFAGPHEPADSDYGHDHNHATNIAGTLGALAMGGHVFLDGVALGVAFQVSDALGYAVFVARRTHRQSTCWRSCVERGLQYFPALGTGVALPPWVFLYSETPRHRVRQSNGSACSGC